MFLRRTAKDEDEIKEVLEELYSSADGEADEEAQESSDICHQLVKLQKTRVLMSVKATRRIELEFTGGIDENNQQP